MSELPKWLGALIARLLPKQKTEGDHAAQFGKVGGNVTIVHLTQHLPAAPAPLPVVPAPVAPTLVVPAPAAPMPVTPAAPPFRPAGGVANAEQRQVLQLMRQLPHPGPVHEFMQREFGTHMVIHLQPPQLYRVRRYVEKIIQSAEPVAAGARPFQPTQGNQR